MEPRGVYCQSLTLGLSLTLSLTFSSSAVSWLSNGLLILTLWINTEHLLLELPLIVDCLPLGLHAVRDLCLMSSDNDLHITQIAHPS